MATATATATAEQLDPASELRPTLSDGVWKTRSGAFYASELLSDPTVLVVEVVDPVTDEAAKVARTDSVADPAERLAAARTVVEQVLWAQQTGRTA